MSTLLRSHFADTLMDPEHPVLLGLVDIDGGGSKVFLNGVSVAKREYLLPDSRGSWAILYEDGCQRLTGAFAPQALPVGTDLETVTAIGGLVSDSPKRTWQELEEISPAVPDLGSRIKLTALERAIQHALPYLEEACARPKAYLKFETMRVYVSQARRMPARAASYLAAHTEDWERPTLLSVQPKRVLAEVREDEFDIYENRLAVRLVDHLLRVVGPRIAEVSRAQRILAELLDYSGSTRGSHWRAKRICSLWAETVTAEQGEKRARNTLDQLIAIRQRLLALKDSALYRSIPLRADVSDSLKMTNILATDPVYRHVAILWLEWSRNTARRQKPPAQVFGEYRGFCDAFKRYCLLLVVRALSQLGISAQMPEERRAFGAGARVRLSKADLTLSVTASGLIELSAKGQIMISFLPLPAALNRARTDEELELWLSQVSAGVHGVGVGPDRVVLYLSSLVGGSRTLSLAANRYLQTVGNEPSLLSGRKFGLMPVSPWEIDCVERVARCLRWALTAAELRSFPASVRAALPASLTTMPPWLFRVGNELRVLRHPRPHERRGFDIDAVWETAKRTLATAEDEERRLNGVERRGRTPHHERKALAQDAARSRADVRTARTAFYQVDTFKREIERILADHSDVSNCPACGSAADTANGYKHDAKFYEFTCGDCKAQWGVRTCRCCGMRVPFLEIGSTIAIHDRGPGWIDRYVGRDVLAIPLGDGRYECSACGKAV
jgi:hypothetical protein